VVPHRWGTRLGVWSRPPAQADPPREGGARHRCCVPTAVPRRPSGPTPCGELPPLRLRRDSRRPSRWVSLTHPLKHTTLEFVCSRAETRNAPAKGHPTALSQHPPTQYSVSTHQPARQYSVSTHQHSTQSAPTNTVLSQHPPTGPTVLSQHPPTTRQYSVSTHQPARQYSVSTHQPSRQYSVSTHQPARQYSVSTHQPARQYSVSTHQPARQYSVSTHQPACVPADAGGKGATACLSSRWSVPPWSCAS
jgi:hypothetical protein